MHLVQPSGQVRGLERIISGGGEHANKLKQCNMPISSQQHCIKIVTAQTGIFVSQGTLTGREDGRSRRDVTPTTL